MNYNSLYAKYQTLIQKENDLQSNTDHLLLGCKKISTESERVAQVARDSEQILRKLDYEFSVATKITNQTDMSFLFFATALQCLRWFLLNKIMERTPEGANKFEDWAHRAQDKTFGTDGPVSNASELPFNRYNYYVPLETIMSTYSVPYDAIKGTKNFDVSGSGGGLTPRSHRYRTLGHDPILGFVFGTSNILSSTLTNWQFSTFFVDSSNVVVGRASTVIMFEKIIQRIMNEPQALGAAVIKQALHLVSDAYTTSGIPIPIVQTLSPQLAQELGKYGLDAGGLFKAGVSAKMAALIDTFIATIHALYYDKNLCTWGQFEVRTRKILLISKMIAEGSNILASILTQNVYNLDIGGIIYTFSRILKDIELISELKREFIRDSFEKMVIGDIDFATI